MKKPAGDLNGFLDSGSRFTGELTFEDTFRLDGNFHGKIDSAGDLIIGDGASVDAEIQIRRVFISGAVRGTIKATERIEISPGGNVDATLSTPSLVVEDGAIFEGQCMMSRGSRSSSASTPVDLATRRK